MEESLLPQTQEEAGFEPALVRQFTVFLENRVGRLQSLVRSIEASSAKIVALSIEESTDSSLVRMIVSDADVGRAALTASRFSFTESELLAVECPKRSTQPLMAICSALLAAEINIHFAYPLLVRPRGPALAMYVDDPILASRLLIKKGFVLLGESDLKE